MKSTTNKPLACDDLWNERQAHFSMQQSKEQVARDRIADRNHQARQSEQLRKHRLNEQFWHKVKVSILQIICVLVIAYTLTYFIG